MAWPATSRNHTSRDDLATSSDLHFKWWLPGEVRKLAWSAYTLCPPITFSEPLPAWTFPYPIRSNGETGRSKKLFLINIWGKGFFLLLFCCCLWTALVSAERFVREVLLLAYVLLPVVLAVIESESWKEPTRSGQQGLVFRRAGAMN